MKYKSKGDVEWRLPGKRKPFAYSTKATSDLIAVFDDLTIQQAHDAINYDREAKAILQTYIENGYGNEPVNRYFR